MVVSGNLVYIGVYVVTFSTEGCVSHFNFEVLITCTLVDLW